MQKQEIKDLYAIYHCKDKAFQPSDGFKKIWKADMDFADFIEMLIEEGIVTRSMVNRFQRMLEEVALSKEPEVRHAQFSKQEENGELIKYYVGFICTRPQEEIIITLSRMDKEADKSPDCAVANKIDELTGLFNKNTFTTKLGDRLKHVSLKSGQKIIVVYFDIQRFKVINDLFGMTEGDWLLIHIANAIQETVGDEGAGCRLDSDRFLFFQSVMEKDINETLNQFFDKVVSYELPFEIACNAGVYIISDNVDHSLRADAIIDRAIIAQAAIKGSYTERFKFYEEEMRQNLISEQEITGSMRTALKEKQFIIYYQPQYNHTTGMLVGAEALVRWQHPESGLIPPGRFIPVFEKNGFITNLDLYVFENVCKFIRSCMDHNYALVPVSVNLTRYDIFSPNFIEKLEKARMAYDVPSKYLRIEITESAAIGNSKFINDAIEKLHSYGYVVEMDDFGSGYSSLNILKDINFDIIKLDMKFLQNENETANKGGTILSSVVRMLNWLGMPIIAEGVETMKQAEFLRSIGCDYIQGYLYSKPLAEEDFCRILSESAVGNTIPRIKLIDNLNAKNFWSNESLETLIFSNYVGGAAIFEYRDGKIEMLRVNQKYIKEMGMNLSEKQIIHTNPLLDIEEGDRKVYTDMLDLAIKTNEEQECETWRKVSSSCCGEDHICIRSSVRMIGEGKESYLFYVMIRNITAEKERIKGILDTEKRFKMASEQVNIYYWEYTVATREMRPCFRCMRDLGLPALLRNYPDSAIEMGVFPPEVADMYRDWHRQIAEGVPELEAVIPLTVGRVPFRVRYTTEFDENGRAVKAYGSAALVV